MIGNTIYFKDNNLKDCKGRILDKVLVEDEYYLEQSNQDNLSTGYKLIVTTKYLVITKPNSCIVLVKPNQIKKVL